MDRRALLTASLATGVSPVATLQAAPPTTRRITIEAPEDVQVFQVLAPDGRVSKGTPLFRLQSINIERMSLQLSMFESHLEIVERPFHDGRVDAEISVLQQKADLTRRIMVMSQQDVDRRDGFYHTNLGQQYSTVNRPPLDDRYFFLYPVESETSSQSNGSTSGSQTSTHGGIIDNTPPYAGTEESISNTTGVTSETHETSKSTSRIVNPDYKSDYELQLQLTKATDDYLDAKVASESADKKRADALDKIALSRTKLSEYRKLLVMRQDLLNIYSNYVGLFTCTAALGTAVKKGHLLGEIIL